MKGSLRLRVALAAGVSVTLASLLISLTAWIVIARIIDHDIQQVLNDRLAAAAATVVDERGQVRVRDSSGDAVLDSDVWILSGDQVLAKGSAVQAVQDAVPRVAAAAPSDTEVGGVHLASRVVGPDVVVVAALDTRPYQRAERLLSQVLIALDLFVIALATLLALLLARTALRPVTRMTAQARDWSEHDIERRFDLGPAHDEITALAATLDAMLDRIASSLRHEQRFSAEVVHELRTPLATMLSEADIALAHGDDTANAHAALAAIREQGQRLREIVDTLMAAAHQEADPRSGLCEVHQVLEDLALDWDVTVDESPEAVIGVDGDLTARILAPVVENALRNAQTTVRVWAQVGKNVVLHVWDDGPGVADPASVFEPGVKGPDSSGAGLGLPLAQRLASAAGGRITVVPDTTGGHFAIELPRG